MKKVYAVTHIDRGSYAVEFNGDFNNQPVVLGAEFGWTRSKAYGSPLWKVMNGEEHEQEDSLSEGRCGQAEREDTTTQESCKKITERGKDTST
jgi:hypothetical protein